MSSHSNKSSRVFRILHVLYSLAATVLVLVLAVQNTALKKNAYAVAPDFERVYRIDLEETPVKGPNDATVTIVGFLNFGCSHCQDGLNAVNRIYEEFPGRVRLAFKHWLTPTDRESVAAVGAVMAAGQQGMFWEMAEILMENQDRLNSDFFNETASAMGLDMDRFQQDSEPARWVDLLKRDMDIGLIGGVSGAPSFFINGHKVEGGDYGNLRIAVDTLLGQME